MTLHRRLTVLALASIPLGCPSDSTPSTDDTSGTTENDDNDNDDDEETTDDPSSVSLTTDDPSTSTDPSTTIDPDSSTDPTEDPTSETTDDPTTETTDDPSTESSSTDGESSSTTDTGGSDCAQFQIMGDLQPVGVNGGVFRLTAADISGASNAAIDDFLQFEFYLNGDTGSFDLAAPPEDNYATCAKCILVYEDVVKGDVARFFYQSQGTLEIDANSDIEGIELYATISDVRLVEVTIDPVTFTSTPVVDGLCIDLVDGDAGTVEVPDEWTCNPLYYATGDANDCDCGCGVVDPDCVDMAADSCDFCDNLGSCGDGGDCPANIDPVDNSQCVENQDESQDLIAGPGLDLDVDDDAYTGSLDTMSCVDLPLVAGGPDTVSGAQLELAMSHTWVGDLVVKVVSPEGTVVTVLSRPGFAEVADDGAPAPGDSSNLVITSPLTYVNGGANDAEAMGGTIDSAGNICEDDAQCVFDPNNGAATAGDFSAFVGESAVGSWRVCVGDAAGGDLGVIDAITLTVNQTI